MTSNAASRSPVAAMKRDRYRAGKRLWSHADDRQLRRLYPDTPTAAIAPLIRRTLASVYQRAQQLGLKKSAAYLASPAACRLRRVGGEHPGRATQFKPGQVPFNKGLRRPGWGPGRMKETQFKPGVRSGVAAKNWRPVGTILADSDGYQRIKVRDARKGEPSGFGNVRVWPLLQRHVWTQAHGSIPPSHNIAFLDGDRANCAIENLECVSRAEMMRRNSVHNLPKPVAQVVHLLGALNRQIRRRSRGQEEQDRRPA